MHSSKVLKMAFKKTKSLLKGSLGKQKWFFYGIALRKYYFGICMTFLHKSCLL